MKTIKSLLRSVIAVTVFTLVSAFFNASGSVEAAAGSCSGVSYGQAVIYLQSCSHHHAVNSIQIIPGTYNYQANVDNNSIVTVNVQNGCIAGHSDAVGTIIVISNTD